MRKQRGQVAERVVSEEVPANTIISGNERGWKIKDDIVRLAQCTVSSGPPVAAAAEAPAEEAPAEEAPAEDAA